MDEVTAGYEQIIARFTAWARAEANIRAAVVIGSRARVDHPADEWSDLDIVILAEDPEPYWASCEWVERIGEPWLTFTERTPDGLGYERRVLFAGGLDVDFVPSPVAVFQRMLETGIPPDLADILHRGVRVLIDKDGLLARLVEAQSLPPAYTPPTEAAYLNLVNDFWYHTVWTGKHLRRGELWWAKSCCDSYLKNLLRQMLAWHAHASQGKGIDTWMRGRFLEEWADPRALAALPDIFAHYDPEDIWQALLATMALFHWLAAETADRLGYPYPSFGEAQATDLVHKMFAARTIP